MLGLDFVVPAQRLRCDCGDPPLAAFSTLKTVSRLQLFQLDLGNHLALSPHFMVRDTRPETASEFPKVHSKTTDCYSATSKITKVIIQTKMISVVIKRKAWDDEAAWQWSDP